MDNYDNIYEVKRFNAKEDATKLMNHLQSLGHHQCYYVESLEDFRSKVDKLKRE